MDFKDAKRSVKMWATNFVIAYFFLAKQRFCKYQLILWRNLKNSFFIWKFFRKRCKLLFCSSSGYSMYFVHINLQAKDKKKVHVDSLVAEWRLICSATCKFRHSFWTNLNPSVIQLLFINFRQSNRCPSCCCLVHYLKMMEILE